jgi:hypothetical protein
VPLLLVHALSSWIRGREAAPRGELAPPAIGWMEKIRPVIGRTLPSPSLTWAVCITFLIVRKRALRADAFGLAIQPIPRTTRKAPTPDPVATLHPAGESRMTEQAIVLLVCLAMIAVLAVLIHVMSCSRLNPVFHRRTAPRPRPDPGLQPKTT